MEIQIFEKPSLLTDITNVSIPSIGETWLVINTVQITVLQRYLAREVDRNLYLSGLFDRPTFKALVKCANSRITNANTPKVYIEYPETSIENMVAGSGVYLQRVITHALNEPVVCDGKIGPETTNALNKLLCDGVLFHINLEKIYQQQ